MISGRHFEQTTKKIESETNLTACVLERKREDKEKIKKEKIKREGWGGGVQHSQKVQKDAFLNLFLLIVELFCTVQLKKEYSC